MKSKILLLASILFSVTISAREYEVEIRNFSFSPSVLTIMVGDTVKWVNKDIVPHSVVSNDLSFSSNTLSSDSKYTLKFSNSGTFEYHCSFHPTMTAKVIVLGTTTSILQPEYSSNFKLYQNYPNPFNPKTRIPFSLVNGGSVKIVIYSIMGKELALINSKYYPSGRHEVEFDGSSLASGIYYYTIFFGEGSFFVATRRMTLTK